MNESKTQWPRRKFIAAISSASAAMMLNPLASLASDTADPKVAAIAARTMGIDTHNHIEVPLDGELMPVLTTDLLDEIKKSGLSAVCLTIALDYGLKPSQDAYTRFVNGFNAIDKVLNANGMKRSMNLSDLKTEHKRHMPTIVQSMEGSHFLDGKIQRVSEAYGRGLRLLTLLHDSDASVPLGDVYTNPPKWNGLTPLGTNVVKECNRLGILVDLAHCSNESINAALKVAQRPVIISHTGLNTQLGKNEVMAKMMFPRLISKKQAKIVAATGGVIGVWTHLADTPLEYAQNIRAMVDVIGTDHVCLGTDTKISTAYRAVNKGWQNRNRAGERTNEAWEGQKTGFYYAVVDALLKTGFTEGEISKIGGGNFCRVFDAATSDH